MLSLMNESLNVNKRKQLGPTVSTLSKGKLAPRHGLIIFIHTSDAQVGYGGEGGGVDGVARHKQGAASLGGRPWRGPEMSAAADGS